MVVPYNTAQNQITHVCPICLGLPGALPAMNLQALKMTALTGLILKCDLAPICKFDRKNYFYPDMPKNYQISQYDPPLCLHGEVPLYDHGLPKGCPEEHSESKQDAFAWCASIWKKTSRKAFTSIPQAGLISTEPALH